MEPTIALTKDAARLSAAARAKKLAPRSCPRCGRLAKPPYYYHYACKNLDDAEFKTRIEAIPEKPMTQEIWERMWKPDSTPFELQQSALRDKPGRQHE